MNQKAYHLKKALTAPTLDDRNRMLTTFSEQNNYDLSPEEWLEIAQLFCEIGQPFLDTVCPLIINA